MVSPFRRRRYYQNGFVFELGLPPQVSHLHNPIAVVLKTSTKARLALRLRRKGIWYLPSNGVDERPQVLLRTPEDVAGSLRYCSKAYGSPSPKY